MKAVARPRVVSILSLWFCRIGFWLHCFCVAGGVLGMDHDMISRHLGWAVAFYYCLGSALRENQQ